MIKIKKGLNLPIAGSPEQRITETKQAQRVAILGPDYVGMKPKLEIQVGDRVKKGQVLFCDKKCPVIRYTAPAPGTIEAINRGHKRALQSVVLQVSGTEELTYSAYTENELAGLSKEKVIGQLIESGLWTALRMRPFSKVADPDTMPNSIFVTAMDTNPLAPAVSAILEGSESDAANGIQLISKLTTGPVFVCKTPEQPFPTLDISNVQIEEFSGPHPAGNVGTHIHFLDPVGRLKTVWHIGLQDVIAVGRLFTSGRLNTERILALAGPSIRKPRLIRTTVGAAVEDVVKGELRPGEHRTISGSVLSGHTATDALAYLGRYHQQVSAIPEDCRRRFLGWLSPGYNLFSVKNIVLSKLFKEKEFNFTTAIHGEVRAILPSGTFEDLMPLDIMPLFLMRAMAVDDVEEADALGALELDEEDLALCAFACPSKLEFGPILRRNLTIIEKEG